MSKPKGMDYSEWNPARVVYLLENEHLKKKSNYIYTLLEDVDITWHWSLKDMEKFDRLWSYGLSLQSIATHMDAEEHEVWLMMIDRALNKKIKPRKGGIDGTLE